MTRKYAESYIDKLISDTEYRSLVDLSSALCSAQEFTMRKPDYGLPATAFVFVETLLWFAQAIRSGVWTYYEATPEDRQSRMQAALHQFAPTDFGDQYSHGMRDWQDEEKIAEVDTWIEANDERANGWLREHARTSRAELLEVTA